jgi:putative membrane protein
MILVLALVIFLLFWLFKQATDKDADRAGRRENRALALLKERYARGEIDEEEYSRKPKEL